MWNGPPKLEVNLAVGRLDANYWLFSLTYDARQFSLPQLLRQLPLLFFLMNVLVFGNTSKQRHRRIFSTSTYLTHYSLNIRRQNAAHRTEMAHPGDGDYRRPDLPTAPIGAPPCPWGAACYRRNPQHFIQLSHLPSSKFQAICDSMRACKFMAQNRRL